MQFARLFCSALLFALALRISSLLHEGAHALVGWGFNASMTVSDFTIHARAPAPVAIAMAAAGPLYSLVQGFACAWLLGKLEPKGTLFRLFLVWLSLHGFSAAFGYLLTAFAGRGDVAVICRLLQAGTVLKALLVGLGALGILWTGWLGARLMLPFAENVALLEAPSARASLLLELAVLPWVLGALMVVAFSWPFQNRFGLLYEFVAGAFTIAAYRFARRTAAPPLVQGWHEVQIWPWALATVIVLLVSRLTIGRPQ
jgi:hypothetical protein